MDENNDNKEGLNIIKQLLVGVKDIKEEEFCKWYEKKKKVFNIGVRKTPTKEEFIKYLNYAKDIYPINNTASFPN